MWLLVFCLCVYIITVCAESDDDNIFTKARAGDIGAVKAFLDNGVDPTTRDNNKGNTPLIIAAGRGHAGVINLLLEAGASYEEATLVGIFEGKSALCWATSQGRVKAVVALLQAGADPNFVQQIGTFAGKTPNVGGQSRQERSSSLIDLCRCRGRLCQLIR